MELNEFFNFQSNRNRVEPLLYSNYYELKSDPQGFSFEEDLKFRCYVDWRKGLSETPNST